MTLWLRDRKKTLAWVRVVLEAKYFVKARGVLGPEPKVERALTFLEGPLSGGVKSCGEKRTCGTWNGSLTRWR